MAGDTHMLVRLRQNGRTGFRGVDPSSSEDHNATCGVDRRALLKDTPNNKCYDCSEPRVYAAPNCEPERKSRPRRSRRKGGNQTSLILTPGRLREDKMLFSARLNMELHFCKLRQYDKRFYRYAARAVG
jgi:hypothetical protein